MLELSSAMRRRTPVVSGISWWLTQLANWRYPVGDVKVNGAYHIASKELTTGNAEYGHDCNYARDVKKRGRKPLSQRLGPGYIPNHTSLDPVTPDVWADHPDQYSPVPASETRSRNNSTGQNAAFVDTEQTVPHGVDRRTQPAFDDYRDRSYNHGHVVDEEMRDDANAPPTTGNRRPGAGHPVRRISQLINPPLPPSTLTNGTEHGRPFLPPMSAPPSLQQPARARYPGCRFKCLEPVMPLLDGVIEAELACDLLEFYFAEPDSALFRHASPYVLSPVIRKRSLLQTTNPRPTTAALLVTMIWTSAQTADIPLLSLPGWRGQICEKLRVLTMALIHDRDRDHWHRALGG